MSKAIYYVSYPLKKGASVPDFLAAAEKLNNEFISKQQGYVSWQQFRDGDIWADAITFETMEDLKNFKVVSKNPSELAEAFYAFINPNPMRCKTHVFAVERTLTKVQ
ncbi:MAG: hypothetical protein FWD06_05010 [Oscillospiraceae bacterium]|nr:hypothetical protein [Oscillospiraceae bacterium]